MLGAKPAPSHTPLTACESPVTMVWPSGETARYSTRIVCPVSVASFCGREGGNGRPVGSWWMCDEHTRPWHGLKLPECWSKLLRAALLFCSRNILLICLPPGTPRPPGVPASWGIATR